MEYNVRLEFNLKPTEDSAENLIDALDGFHPAAGPTDNGNLDVWLTIQAENTRQAVAVGLALAKEINSELLGFEVITTTEFDRLQGITAVPEMISSDEAAAILGVTRQAVLKNPKLRQVRVGERGVAYVRTEVEAHAAK